MRWPAPTDKQFTKAFIEGGWRNVEDLFGQRTALNRKQIAGLGGLEVMQDRRKGEKSSG
jgi:hypothetical protein